MINQLGLFQYPGALSLSAGIFLAFPCVEMCGRAVLDVGQLFDIFLSSRALARKADSASKEFEYSFDNREAAKESLRLQKIELNELKGKTWICLALNISGAAFCGICLANSVPYAAVIGTVAFGIWARQRALQNDVCYTTRVIGIPLKILTRSDTIKFIAKRIFACLKRCIAKVNQVCHKVARFVQKILKAIIKPPLKLLKGIFFLIKSACRNFKPIWKPIAGIFRVIAKTFAGIAKVLVKNPKIGLIAVGAALLTVTCILGGSALLAAGVGLYKAISFGAIWQAAVTVGNVALSIFSGIYGFVMSVAPSCYAGATTVCKVGIAFFKVAGQCCLFIAKPLVVVLSVACTLFGTIFSVCKPF